MSDFPDLSPHAFQAIMKQGGKKKLDQLLDLFKQSAPERVRELSQAQDLSEAKAAARVLKNSCSTLGLAALEDLCDDVLASKSPDAVKPFAAEAIKRLPIALAALVKERATL